MIRKHSRKNGACKNLLNHVRYTGDIERCSSSKVNFKGITSAPEDDNVLYVAVPSSESSGNRHTV